MVSVGDYLRVRLSSGPKSNRIRLMVVEYISPSGKTIRCQYRNPCMNMVHRIVRPWEIVSIESRKWS